MIKVEGEELVVTTEEEVFELFETEDREPTVEELKALEKDTETESFRKEKVLVDTAGDKRLEKFIQEVMFIASNKDYYKKLRKERSEVEALHDNDYVKVDKEEDEFAELSEKTLFSTYGDENEE